MKNRKITTESKQVVLQPFEAYYFGAYKEAILAHNLKSGEIIIEINRILQRTDKLSELIFTFFEQNGLKHGETNFYNQRLDFEQHCINKEQALQNIKYGLSPKTNYTVIDKMFTVAECEKYALGFIEFFRNPAFYIYPSRLWQKDIDLNDFWEVGQVIAIDSEKIGIFRVNDLYDFRFR